jgi:hypothetical protein
MFPTLGEPIGGSGPAKITCPYCSADSGDYADSVMLAMSRWNDLFKCGDPDVVRREWVRQKVLRIWEVAGRSFDVPDEMICQKSRLDPW